MLHERSTWRQRLLRLFLTRETRREAHVEMQAAAIDRSAKVDPFGDTYWPDSDFLHAPVNPNTPRRKRDGLRSLIAEIKAQPGGAQELTEGREWVRQNFYGGGPMPGDGQ